MKIFRTILVVLVFAILSITIPVLRECQPFFANTTLYLAISISSLDLIKSKYKTLVVLFNSIHSPLILLISFWFGALIFTTPSFQGYYIELGMLLNSVLTILILSLSLRFQSLKLAFIGAILVAFASPMLASFISSLIPSINSNDDNFEALVISWQVLMGIVLAISMRMSFKSEKQLV
jgi:hypothetical protein